MTGYLLTGRVTGKPESARIKEILLQALEKHAWHQTKAATFLNISRKTLIYRMEKFGLTEPGESGEVQPVPNKDEESSH